MSLAYRVSCYFAIAALVLAGADHVNAATFNLPLDGTVSIVGDLPASYDPSIFGPVEIEIQAIENFSLPVFQQQNPATTVGVYQWSANFAVLNQSGSPVAEPDLSPFGTALTGYGQNCGVAPYCPSPSGDSSETILAGYLYLSSDALTLQISTNIFTLNVPTYELQLQVTLPDDLSITPLPTALPLFVTGVGVLGLLARRRRRKTSAHLNGM
jgi:hypothetical protein